MTADQMVTVTRLALEAYALARETAVRQNSTPHLELVTNYYADGAVAVQAYGPCSDGEYGLMIDWTVQPDGTYKG